VPSKNPRLGREAQKAFAPEGKMALVTFAETKVTRARGGTRILFSNHRGSDTTRLWGSAMGIPDGQLSSKGK
jgi:hypothetical protein